MTETDKPNLKDLGREELERFFSELGEKPFRAGQVRRWIFGKQASGFDEMTDLSRPLRERLAETARITAPVCEEMLEAEDGTRKMLWRLEDGGRVESVLIRERDHHTLCVSSQVGCAMNCRFCRTAKLGLTRNLTSAEIIDQVIGAGRLLPEGGRLTNLVFMGMGEPLANRANLVKALGVLTEPGLMGFSRRHLSVSTVGLVPELPRLAEAVTIGLTVSVNAADDKTRDRLMPINKKYNMAALHKALAAYPLPRGRRITIAYVLLAGVNDREKDARNLMAWLHGLRVKVNLIPFNAWEGSEFEEPGEESVQRFAEMLVSKNYTVIVRRSKGRDVGAACGQLAGERS